MHAIVFEPGVTAIVGPNRLRQTNVSDAVRWVLGEQRARFMRGVKMTSDLSGIVARAP